MVPQPGRKAYDKTRTAFIGVLTGFVAICITVTAVLTSNSVAVIADMFGTVFEFLAVLFSWLTLRVTARKEGHAFDYGYGKLENLVSIVIAALIFLAMGIVVFNAVGRFSHPQAISGFGVWMVLFAHAVFLCINGNLYWRTHRVLRQQMSQLLESQQRLFAIKTFSNVGMVSALSLSLALQHIPLALYIDPVMSLLIAITMFLGGYRIVSRNLGALLDRSLEEHSQLLIVRALAEFFDEYVALHGVRSRRSGNNVFIELFLEFESERRISEVQTAINRMKASLEGAIPNSEVTIVPSTEPPQRLWD